MKCTSCKTGNLRPHFIDSLFRAHTCDNCEGSWVLVEDFLSWKELNPEYEFAEEVVYETDNNDSTHALLCPVTGALMTKCKITAQSSHRIDYSVSAGGIWLDKGEWQLLKNEGLAGHLNTLVTQSWQNKVRDQTTRDNFGDMYLQQFGEETYQKIQEIREWLQAHPQRAEIRSYLFAEDPYSARR